MPKVPSFRRPLPPDHDGRWRQRARRRDRARLVSAGPKDLARPIPRDRSRSWRAGFVAKRGAKNNSHTSEPISSGRLQGVCGLAGGLLGTKNNEHVARMQIASRSLGPPASRPIDQLEGRRKRRRRRRRLASGARRRPPPVCPMSLGGAARVPAGPPPITSAFRRRQAVAGARRAHGSNQVAPTSTRLAPPPTQFGRPVSQRLAIACIMHI